MRKNRLKELRKSKGFTQLQVELKTGIDQSDYSKMEQGKRYPTMEQAQRLSYLYDTSIDYIYGLTDHPRPYPRAGNPPEMEEQTEAQTEGRPENQDNDTQKEETK